jgi:hypothetical protein
MAPTLLSHDVKLPAPAYPALGRDRGRQAQGGIPLGRDGTCSGPFDGARGPEHVEGLPGNIIYLYCAPSCLPAGAPPIPLG